MEFKILRMWLLKKKLKSNNFYEDINFENRFVSKNVKRNIHHDQIGFISCIQN